MFSDLAFLQVPEGLVSVMQNMEAEGMRAPAGCTMMDAETTGELLFTHWRDYRAEDNRGRYGL